MMTARELPQSLHDSPLNLVGDILSKPQKGLNVLPQTGWASILLIILPRIHFHPMARGINLSKIDVH